MPRKSVSPATQKEATVAESKTEQDVAPRRSARAAAKRDASPVSLEGGRARRSSTAAQTAASVAESRVTRSRSRSTRRGSTSSDSRSKPAKETSLESPAPRVRSSRRSTGRINYKESDGEEESNKGGGAESVGTEDVEEDYNADFDAEASDSEGSNQLKAKGKVTVKSPPKNRQPKSKNRTPKQQGRTKGRASRSKNEEEEDEEEEEEVMETESEIKETNEEPKDQSIEDSTQRPRRRSNRGDSSPVEKKTPVSTGRRSSGRAKPESSTPETKPSRRSTKTPSSETTEVSTRPQRSSRSRQTKVEAPVDKPEEEEEEEEEDAEKELEMEEITAEVAKKRKAEEPAEDVKDSGTKKPKIDSSDASEQLGEPDNVDSDLKRGENEENDVAEETEPPPAEATKNLVESAASEQPQETLSVKTEESKKEIEESRESELEEMEVDSELPPAESAPSNLDSKTNPEELAAEDEKNSNKDEVKSESLDVENKEDEEKDEEMDEEYSDNELEEKEESNTETVNIPLSQPDHLQEPKEPEISKDIAAEQGDQSDSLLETKDLTETSEQDEVYEECQEDLQPSETQHKIETDTANTNMDAVAQEAQLSTEDNPPDDKPEKTEDKQDRGDSVFDGIFHDSLPADEHVTSEKTSESTSQNKPLSLNGENVNEKLSDIYSSHSPPRSEKPDINQEVSSKPEHNLVPKANGAHDIEDLTGTFTPNRNYVINPNFNNDVRESLKDKIFGFVSYNLGATIKDDISHNEKFLAELRRLQADIICLQEVKESFLNEVLEPSLDVLGYKSVVSIPEGRAAGLATFFKNSSFQVTSHSGASLQSLIDKDLQSSSLEIEDKKAVHSFLQKCGHVLFTQLSSVIENQTLMVANVLLPPSDISTHALQMSCLAREVLTRMEGAVKPILLCGAFNMAEGEAAYQLLRDGYLSNEMIEELQKRKDIVLFGKENEALINVLWNAFQHPSSNLCSCYSTVLGHELRLPGDQATTSPDLLWFSSDCLKTVGVLDVLSVTGGNQNSEGNHFTLKADIAFSI